MYSGNLNHVDTARDDDARCIVQCNARRRVTSEYQVVQCVLSLALVCSCEASDPLDCLAAITQQALASAIRLTGIYASAERQ